MARRGPGRPRKGEEVGTQVSSELIIREACELIQKHGYRGTTLEELANRFGVTKPALYRYVKSKRDILVGIIDTSLEQMLSIARSAMETDLPADEKMRLVMERYLYEVTKDEMMAIYFDEQRELSTEYREVISRKEREFVRALEAIYLQGVAEGLFVKRPPLLAVFTILGALSWVHRWYNPSGFYRPEEIATILTDILANGYLVQPQVRKAQG